MDSKHCDCSAYDVPRKWRGSRSSSSGLLPFHPLRRFSWADEVDDDIASLLGESYQRLAAMQKTQSHLCADEGEAELGAPR
jgi:hypothetical protein